MPVVNHRPSRIYWCTRRHWTRKWMKVDRPPPAFQKPASPLLIHEFCFSPLCLSLPPSLFTDSINPPFHPCRLVESFFLFSFFFFPKARHSFRRNFVNYSSITEGMVKRLLPETGMKRILLLWRVVNFEYRPRIWKKFLEIEISLNQGRIEILLKVDSKEENRSFLSNKISYYR